MNQLDITSPAYNYYPQTMIQLCVISYDDIGSIAGQVSSLTDQTVVWGPAQLVSDLGISYSLAYITKRNGLDQYTVVIRGTNMDSWTAWTTEDFAVGQPMALFNQFDPRAPSSALISMGTFNGINDLLSLKDPKTKKGMAEFLQQTKPPMLFVTGHSLGGTLTPPLYAFLQYNTKCQNMAMWSFAGLTSGNGDFAKYINSLMSPGFMWRFYNTLDIAPFCFASWDGLKNVYAAQDLYWSLAVEAFWDLLFSDASAGNYTQPAGNNPLPGDFQGGIDDWVWTAQAMYQHHSTTYQGLITSAFPLDVASV